MIRTLPGLARRLLELSPQELGLLGEELAARELHARGFAVLGRRLRTPAGEADLLCRLAGRRVVVEVKASRLPPGGSRWRPADRVDWRRRSRLAATARYLGADRVDLVEVVFSGRNTPARFSLLADLPLDFAQERPPAT